MCAVVARRCCAGRVSVVCFVARRCCAGRVSVVHLVARRLLFADVARAARRRAARRRAAPQGLHIRCPLRPSAPSARARHRWSLGVGEGGSRGIDVPEGGRDPRRLVRAARLGLGRQCPSARARHRWSLGVGEGGSWGVDVPEGGDGTGELNAHRLGLYRPREP